MIIISLIVFIRDIIFVSLFGVMIMMEVDNRPDSRQLLKKVETEESYLKKGKLKIFFGYAAGVGKTYSMLQEAHELRNNNIDVVVGYIERHTRKDTLALIDGLESLNTRKIDYKGVTIEEFDLNSALERSPEVLLVDELPHTNPPFFRHRKRWKDIEELLDAGINVYTTLNVQHLESLNDVIASITGVFVKETVPDYIVDRADKIELIDIATDDLKARFDEGKIYKKENVDKAKSNFFTDDNLKALRELSLRKTADTVNSVVQISRLSKGNINILPTKEKIVACISASPSSAKVIRTAARMASSFKTEWVALYVGNLNSKNMTSEEKKRLREHIKLAETLGGIVEMIHGNDVVEAIIKFCNYRNITKIIIGRNVLSKKALLKVNRKDIVDKLIEKVKHIEVHVIPTSIEPMPKKKVTFNINNTLKEKILFSKKDILIAILFSLLATTVAVIINHLKFAEANILLVYILAILFISVNTKGYAIGIIFAFINVLCFNFFFTHPKLTLRFDDPTYLVTFPFFVLVATITSTLTTRIKEQADMFEKREEAAQMLYEISRSFINLSGEENIINTGITHLSQGLRRDTICYEAKSGILTGDYIIKNINENLKNEQLKDDKNFEIAYWVLNNRKRAGRGTDTHNGSEVYYIPIIVKEKIFGVIGVFFGNDDVDKDDMSLIEAVVAQMSLALDREELVKEKEKTKLEFEREQLRSNLLRAISHDLRTPLTGIEGSSSLILESYDSLNRDVILNLVKEINDDSEWLIRLVENLLSMTRIESGKLEIKKTEEIVEEIVSESIQHLKNRLNNHKLTVDMPKEVLFVPMDGKLIEQVIINLVDNAIKYTPEGSEVNIRVYRKNNNAYFEITDNGPGINKDDINHLFEIFYKGNKTNADSRRGVGLGLSICRSIVLAHGGEISAKNNKLGGAKFIFSLPLNKIYE